MANASPPGYKLRTGRRRPVLGEYLARIEELLRVDETQAPDKQRHTGEHIFIRLRDEFGCKGGSTQVREYTAELRARSKGAFIPLVSSPARPSRTLGKLVSTSAESGSNAMRS